MDEMEYYKKFDLPKYYALLEKQNGVSDEELAYYKKFNLPKYFAILEERENGVKAEPTNGQVKPFGEVEEDIYQSETFLRQFDNDNKQNDETDPLQEFAAICAIVNSVM